MKLQLARGEKLKEKRKSKKRDEEKGIEETEVMAGKVEKEMRMGKKDILMRAEEIKEGEMREPPPFLLTPASQLSPTSSHSSGGHWYTD